MTIARLGRPAPLIPSIGIRSTACPPASTRRCPRLAVLPFQPTARLSAAVSARLAGTRGSGAGGGAGRWRSGRARSTMVRLYRQPEGDEKGMKVKRAVYEERMAELHLELVKLQHSVKQQGVRVILVFEGRDAAGKGGTIKRLTE